jgi:DNA-binding XRE family transcriptional regulator
MSGDAQGWQRLQWARETHGAFPSKEAFAKRIGVKGHTYRAHERDPDDPSKHIELDFDKAVKWADVLDVRWEWLLKGEGVPWRDRESTPSTRTMTIPAEHADAVEAFIAALTRKVGRTGTGG